MQAVLCQIVAVMNILAEIMMMTITLGNNYSPVTLIYILNVI